MEHHHKGWEAARDEGLAQAGAHARQARADETHVLNFDRDPARPWSEKIRHETHSSGGRSIDGGGHSGGSRSTTAGKRGRMRHTASIRHSPWGPFPGLVQNDVLRVIGS